MTTLAKRKKLSEFIHVADDKKVNAMYAILKNEINLEERIGIDQYNKEIDEAEAEVKAGKFVSQAQMEKLASKW